MEQDFYVGRLRSEHGLDVRVPGAADRADRARRDLRRAVRGDRARRLARRVPADHAALADEGAQGILLGCTEIDLLVGPADSPVPVFDTTRLHAERAVTLALEP